MRILHRFRCWKQMVPFVLNLTFSFSHSSLTPKHTYTQTVAIRSTDSKMLFKDHDPKIKMTFSIRNDKYRECMCINVCIVPMKKPTRELDSTQASNVRNAFYIHIICNFEFSALSENRSLNFQYSF